MIPNRRASAITSGMTPMKTGFRIPASRGSAGVTVRLIDPATDTVLDTTTTDGSGYYGFTGLAPGDYAVEFDLPTDYQFTAQDNGPDDVFDSDADITTGRTRR